MLRRAYDVDKGIYSESYTKKHPYAVIEAHKFETNAFNGLYHLYAERYERFNVWDRFHISLTDFMEQHPEDCEWMINYSEARQREEEKMAENVKNRTKQSIITDPNQVAADIKKLNNR